LDNPQTVVALSSGMAVETRDATAVRQAGYFVWDKNNDAEFYWLENNSLYLNALSGEQINKQKLLNFDATAEIGDFNVFNQRLLFIEKNNGRAYLVSKSLTANDNSPISRIELNSANCAIRDFIDNKILVEATDKRILYLISDTLDAVLLEKTDAMGYDYDNDENKFLVYSDNEISIADFKNYPYEWQTVTRVSAGITRVSWFTEPNYLFFVKDKTLNFIELDERDHRNLITLPPTNVGAAALSAKGDTIYYTGLDGGLFELAILD
jgi:hypothetical protein